MRVMVMIKATADSEAGKMPDTALLEKMGAYNQALVEAGVMVGGDGLHPSSRGKRVRFTGSERLVVDGPFAETKELIAGFWIWKVASMEEALEWARKCPDPMPGQESELELRPIFDPDDFGEAFTPELRAQEAALAAEIERQQGS